MIAPHPLVLFGKGRKGSGGRREEKVDGKAWEEHWRDVDQDMKRGPEGPLAAALLLLLALLLADEVGHGAGDTAYHGPVFIKADAPVMVGIQVLDEFVSCLSVPCVL